MKRKILFILGGLLNFYVFPFICYQTMEGDKGDIGLGLLVLIPMGLALLSFLWGLFCPKMEEMLFPILCAVVMILPLSLIEAAGVVRALGLGTALGYIVGTMIQLVFMALCVAAPAAGFGYLVRCGVLFLLNKWRTPPHG